MTVTVSRTAPVATSSAGTPIHRNRKGRAAYHPGARPGGAIRASPGGCRDECSEKKDFEKIGREVMVRDGSGRPRAGYRARVRARHRRGDVGQLRSSYHSRSLGWCERKPPFPAYGNVLFEMPRRRNPDDPPPSPFGSGNAPIPPPPSAALNDYIARMGRVRPRVPKRSLLIVALGACAYPAWTLTALPLRPDLGVLPVAWTIVVGSLWLAGFGLPLTFAVVPPSGQVLPDGRRALRIATLMAALSISASLLLGIAALVGGPPLPRAPATSLTSWGACVAGGLRVSVPTTAVATFTLRRVVMRDSWRLGAAIGAAGGMLAGLVLHLTCSNRGPGHLALAHGGGVVIGALLGALTYFMLDRSRP